MLRTQSRTGQSRSAGFQTCRITDFQIGRSSDFAHDADLEIRDTADLEVGATSVSTRQALLRILLSVDVMNPDHALAEQIKCYRQMTGEQRLAIALELHEMSCNVAREGIRRQHPKANPAEVERLLHRRLELALTA